MKDATRAPAYACLYPGLCEIARKNGYAMAIHGTITNDLDLVAIPWVDNCTNVETLLSDVNKYLNFFSKIEISLDVEGNEHFEPEQKPHGRIAWKLHMDHGCAVDLSVILPRAKEE